MYQNISLWLKECYLSDKILAYNIYIQCSYQWSGSKSKRGDGFFCNCVKGVITSLYEQQVLRSGSIQRQAIK